MKRLFLLITLFSILITGLAQTPIKDGIKVGRISPILIDNDEIKTLNGITTSSTIQEQINTKLNISDLADPDPVIYSAMSVIPTTYVTDNYTLILTDAGKFVSMTAATDKTITIPLFATVAYAVNTVIYFENLGTADLIIAITTTGTLTSESSWVKIPAKGCAFIKKSATNIWNLSGRLKA